MFFIDRRIGVWTVKGKHGSCGNEDRTRVGHWDQRPEERGSLCDAFLLLRDNSEYFFLLFL